MEKVRYVCPLTVSVPAEDPEGFRVLVEGDTLDVVETVSLKLFTTSFLNSKNFLFIMCTENITQYMVAQ